MRLATCVAIELGVGATVAAAVAAASLWCVSELGQGLGREAQAAEAPTRVAYLPAELPRVVDERGSAPSAVVPGVRPGSGMFLGQADLALLDPLATAPLASVKFNRGGSSLSLRFDFEGGARAAFKPNQTNLQTVPRKEIAAFRVARLLGLGNVAPAVGRRFSVADIDAHLRPESRGMWARFMAETVRTDGQVDGELSFWIPVIQDAKIDGYRIDTTDGIVTWRRLLTVGHDVPAADVNLVRQISDMVLFDYVINNPDRWSGNNTKMSDDGTTLFFMDNAMAFSPDRRGHSKVRAYLERAQKFSGGLVERLRGLDDATLRGALSWEVEPFPFLLSEPEIAAILVRRDAALAYLDELVAAHGADAVMVFP